MVTRKPVPQPAALDPAVPQEARGAWPPGNTEDETIWGDGVQDQQGQQSSTNLAPTDVPNSLRPGAATSFSDFGEESNIWAEGAPALFSTGDTSQVPEVLRPGSSHGNGAHTSQRAEAAQESVPVVLRPGGGTKPETNPFKRKMSLSASHTGQGKQTAPPNIPPLPSAPVSDFSQLNINESSTNPWQPAVNERQAAATPPVPRLPDQDSMRGNVWDSARPSRQPTPAPGSTSPALVSLPSEEGSTGWEEESKKPIIAPQIITTADEEGLEDAHAWDDLKCLDKGKGLDQPPPVPSKDTAGADDWNLIDMETRPVAPSRQSSWENFREENSPAKTAPAAEVAAKEEPPQLPPRNSTEAPPPPQPPRPVDKSETYQIKNISWHDATAAENPRTSPILVQNANGPCPLVALVNALTLTTPADKTNTALVETLRSREQVSLGLLLDAVFDELMSERRTQPDVPLPDVTELYNFLQGLHTGMNVNPRFVPTPEVVTAFKRTSLTHLHPTERTDMIPGTFEHTHEMALYSIFSIPLIHGWLPSKDDVVYEAFARQAASYEDTQNLLFREEELEERLCNHQQGLSPEEQQIYQDILTIKSFLSISATQLTKFGLEVIKKAMKPGSVAILFRNDHFSTLYRHPQTMELHTLVTDAGYVGHAEVVWESLVDINGESAEFFSGDFRLVGGATHSQPGPARGNVPVEAEYSEWTPAQSGRGRAQTAQQSPSTEPPLSPKHEQEDRDLALALQLQEEEDERARAEQERRRRESALSEQFIEQQARTGTTNNPAARGGRGGSTTNNTGGRGRGASHSTASLTPSTGSAATTGRGGGRRTTPFQPAGRGATSTPIPIPQSAGVVAAGGGGGGGTPSPRTTTAQRPTTQTVRSLIPPRTTNRPADEGLDDAPPSYEQASKQLPYLPPQGHPAHPASRQGELSSSPLPSSGMGRGQSQGLGIRNTSGGGMPGYPGSDGRGGQGYYRRGGPPPPPSPVPAGASGGGGKDRECVVM
ncbi:hypothetical protein C8A00DRAFT_11501 [Chaetomidium leptoderma]|uniref:MINDY deubiquitinase domain-containing protein n=1 Tax=Chaetomidium leptoderma TaxID=669021 RepID=A0AAN7A170_9PEZI|nr:hypothetical protein C8A00DRAFT_11501 [Chaetomidium leptoderma]